MLDMKASPQARVPAKICANCVHAAGVNVLGALRNQLSRSVQKLNMYTQLIQFESDEFHSAVAKTVDEARKLIEAGFESVATQEGIMLFRKRK